MDSKLVGEAKQALRREFQTDLWKLLWLLYPGPQHFWSESVHRPICDFFVQKDPERPIAEQDKQKQRLYLDPRNHFKTTIDIVDCVQWVLCFPDVRILIASGTRDNAMKMCRAVKAHFQYNEGLRFFFPELCPVGNKAEDFGTHDSFICPARRMRWLREPTCSIASPDSTVAGMHYDVLKFDDLVNETNSRTADALKQVNNWYKLTNPLLEPYGYRDVIGTRYDFSDLYGEILGDDDDTRTGVGIPIRGYLVSRRSCFLENGEPMFPERFTKERLEAERNEMGTFLFSAQYLNKPVPSDSQHFPWTLVEKCFIKRSDLPPARNYFTTFDLAISQASDADNTAIVTCSICRPSNKQGAHIYVEDIRHGHMKPLDVISALYDVYKKYKPAQIRTEQVGFQRLLEPILMAEAQRRNQFLPMVWIPRDNREAKQARIAALQPWLQRGELHICNDIPYREQLVLELVRFPKYKNDDIVDALADQLALVAMFSGQLTTELPPLSSKVGDPLLGLLA
jgi:predicted phage terminase large subunit-like protein